MFNGTSPFSDSVDTTFLLVLGVSLVVFIGIVIAIITFLIKYRRSKNPYPTNIEGNVTLEIVWTVIPLILFMGMFYLGWRGYVNESNVPEDAVVIHVTARMWAWSFQYPDGVVTDTLYVPAYKSIKLLLKSADVDHSFFIPSFRIKKDVIPNRENVLWFKTSNVDSYDIACAEYCGLRHSYMYSKVISLDSSAFDSWYHQISAKQSKPYKSFYDRELAVTK